MRGLKTQLSLSLVRIYLGRKAEWPIIVAQISTMTDPFDYDDVEIHMRRNDYDVSRRGIYRVLARLTSIGCLVKRRKKWEFASREYRIPATLLRIYKEETNRGRNVRHGPHG